MTSIISKIADVAYIFYDFDGIFTDNHAFISDTGHEHVRISRSDGFAVGEISKLNIQQVILSTESNSVVSARAKKLSLPCIYGSTNKAADLQFFFDANNISGQHCIYVGNDVNDLDAMLLCEYRIAPQDAHPKILSVATHILPVNGGAHLIRYLLALIDSSLSYLNVSQPLSESRDKLTEVYIEELNQRKALYKALEPLCRNYALHIHSYLEETLSKSGKFIWCGNGGSFADSLHLSAELTGRLRIERSPLPSVVLGANPSSLTAIANDYGYENIFSRELSCTYQEHDLLIVLSTSGTSTNVINAINSLPEGARVLFISGDHPISIPRSNLLHIRMPSKNTALVQEAYKFLLHTAFSILDNELCYRPR